jgi:hypothetical protein
MPNMRTRLVTDELARHRTQFEHFCRSLNAEELAAPIPQSPWSVQDYIAHLCTIDALIAAGFGPRAGVAAPPPDVPIPQPFDIDDWNQAAIEARRGRTVDELLAEGAATRANMVRAIEAMTDEHLDQVIPYGGDRKTLGLKPTPLRFGGLLWGISLHDPTHTRDILRAIPERAKEPWIHEWLSSTSDALIPAGVREQRV